MTSVMTDYIHVSDGGEVSFIPGEMTNNRTTELLREGLTERGIEWHSGLEGVTLVGDWCFVEYDNGLLAATCEAALTPEQAIAATLGRGTLTAEQVREAIMSADRREKPMGNTGLTNTHLIIRDDGWQAIADELNAELGSGTCDAIFDKDYYVGINGVCESLKCSSCGNPLSAKFRHCPWCGARIRKVVGE